MVRICAIGDPHGNLKRISKVPRDVDFYLITGDLGRADTARNLSFENFKRKRRGLPEKEISLFDALRIDFEVNMSSFNVLKYLSEFAKVYTIQGNVGDEDVEEICLRMENVLMIKDKLLKINDLKIGFLEYFTDSSWVKEFRPSSYRKNLIEAKEETERVRKVLERFGRVDILVCHQPPFGFLDKVKNRKAPKEWQGKRAGSKAILDYIRKYQPKYVFCGHIHEV